MKNILVTLELNESDAIILEAAYSFAKAFNAKLWLMHIAAPDPDFVGYEPGPQYIRDNRADVLRKEHRLLQSHSNTLIEKGIETEGLLVQGPTIEMIIEESKKLQIDLIMTGHHDHGFLHRMFVGSVSAEVIKQSKIPVLMIPFN